MLDLKLIITDNSIITDMYRKPAQANQYLQWTSHHLVQQKLGIIRMLMYRADTLIPDEGRRGREKSRLGRLLGTVEYPEWALND